MKVMKQWLKTWDEMNLKDDVQIEESQETMPVIGSKPSSLQKFLIPPPSVKAAKARFDIASAINMSHDVEFRSGLDSPLAVTILTILHASSPW